AAGAGPCGRPGRAGHDVLGDQPAAAGRRRGRGRRRLGLGLGVEHGPLVRDRRPGGRGAARGRADRGGQGDRGDLPPLVQPVLRRAAPAVRGGPRPAGPGPAGLV
ncbi:MAG: hypothetical protein AVDCRST_MAG41-3729, partial [uncultured Corynebacteriales bacterium]